MIAQPPTAYSTARSVDRLGCFSSNESGLSTHGGATKGTRRMPTTQVHTALPVRPFAPYADHGRSAAYHFVDVVEKHREKISSPTTRPTMIQCTTDSSGRGNTLATTLAILLCSVRVALVDLRFVDCSPCVSWPPDLSDILRAVLRGHLETGRQDGVLGRHPALPTRRVYRCLISSRASLFIPSWQREFDYHN